MRRADDDDLDDGDDGSRPLDFERRRAPPVHNHYYREAQEKKDAGSGGIRRVAEAVIIALIITLGGSVWLLRESIIVLQTSYGFLAKSSDRHADDIKELQGKTFRGVPGYEEDGSNVAVQR